MSAPLGMPAFPRAAADVHAGHPAARQPARTPPTPSAPSGPPPSPSSTTGPSCGPRAPRSRTVRCAISTTTWSGWRPAVTAAGGQVHWAADAAEANRIVTAAGTGHRRDARWSRSSPWPPRRSGSTRRWSEAGIRAYETDLAELIVQLGDDLPSHILVPAIHRNRGEIRDIFRREMGELGPPGTRGADRLPRRARRGGAAASAGEVPAREGRDLRRQLHGRRDRHPGRRGVRGQRPDVPDPPRDADLRRRHREGGAQLAGPGGLSAAAAPLLHRRADEPVHLHVDGHDGRRRAADLPSRAARQRAHRHPRRHRRAAGPALYPLLGLSERLPGLRAGRRPCVRLAVPRPDRRHPHSRNCAGRTGCVGGLPPVCLDAVRGLLRGVPGRHRHPRGAASICGSASSRAGRSPGAGRAPSSSRPRGTPRSGPRCARRPGRSTTRARCAAGRAWRPAPVGCIHGGCRARAAPGRRTRDLPAVPAESFRDWWQRTRGTTSEHGPASERGTSSERGSSSEQRGDAE